MLNKSILKIATIALMTFGLMACDKPTNDVQSKMVLTKGGKHLITYTKGCSDQWDCNIGNIRNSRIIKVAEGRNIYCDYNNDAYVRMVTYDDEVNIIKQDGIKCDFSVKTIPVSE